MERRRVYIGVLAVCLVAGNFAFSQTKPKPLTNSDVVAMVKGGLPENVIISSIGAQDTNFDVSAAALISLKKQGVSTAIMNAMLSASSKHPGSEPGPAASTASSNVMPPNHAVETAPKPNAPAPVPPSTAPAPQPQAGISGVYKGEFRCGVAKFDLALSLTPANPGSLTGKFDFAELFPQRSQQRYVYDLRGTYEHGTQKFRLNPVRWETAPLPGYRMLGIKGTYNAAAQQIKGKISSWICGGVTLTRNQDQSGPTQAPQQGSPQAATSSAPAAQSVAHQPSHPHYGGIFGGLNRLGARVDESVRTAEGAVQPHPLSPTVPGRPLSSVHNQNQSATAPSAQPLSAKVKETLLGPRYPGPFILSKDGGHTAIEVHKGSRRALLIDGSEGPTFDKILGTVFSSNGKESGYIGRSGGSLIPVVDGKELGAISVSSCRPIVAIDPWTPIAGEQQGFLLLSPDGSHFAYVTGLGRGCSPTATDLLTIPRPSVFLDGKETFVHATILRNQFMFAGDLLIYEAQTEDKKWHVAVNNVLGPPYQAVGPLYVSPNGAHYAFVASKPGGQAVVTDGVEGVTHRYGVDNGMNSLTVDSTGRVAYVAGTTPGADGPRALYVGNKEISENWAQFSIGQNYSARVAFNPDGHGFAYVKRVAGGGVAVVVNGKQGLIYNSITDLQFSPHGTHLFYVGVKGSLKYPVVDGRELGEENLVDNIRFSSDGSRYAFEEYKNGRYSVVVDGKESPLYSELIKGSLTFSPDGKHYAFAGCTNVLKCEVVIDGRRTPVISVGKFSTRTTNIHFPPILFSPDSKHVAYDATFASRPGGQALFLDGKPIAQGSYYSYPTFSPDSRHFAAWLWSGRNWHLIVDGKLGPSYDDLIESNPHTVHFVDAHTLQFLGVKAGSVYRVRVDLGQ